MKRLCFVHLQYTKISLLLALLILSAAPTWAQPILPTLPQVLVDTSDTAPTGGTVWKVKKSCGATANCFTGPQGAFDAAQEKDIGADINAVFQVTTCAVSGVCGLDTVAPAAPNGLRVNTIPIFVVSEQDSNGVHQLFIRKADGSEPRQLTFNKSKSWMPAISPDGDLVAYVVLTSTAADIHVIDIHGSRDVKITSGGMNITPCWTRNGESLIFAYSPSPKTVSPRLYIMNQDGSERKRLLAQEGSFSEVAPTVSPDGKYIAFTSDRSGSDKFEIWKAKLDGSNLTRLTTVGYDKTIMANIQQKVPAWSPDGARIALWRGVEMTELRKDASERDRKIIQSWKICVMNKDGSGLTALDFGDDPVWSHDGKHILHPDPMNRDQNRNGEISVKATPVSGGGTTLFRTNKHFGRMDIGYIKRQMK